MMPLNNQLLQIHKTPLTTTQETTFNLYYNRRIKQEQHQQQTASPSYARNVGNIWECEGVALFLGPSSMYLDGYKGYSQIPCFNCVIVTLLMLPLILTLVNVMTIYSFRFSPVGLAPSCYILLSFHSF